MSPRAGRLHGSPTVYFPLDDSKGAKNSVFLALNTVAGVFGKAIKNRKEKCDVITLPW